MSYGISIENNQGIALLDDFSRQVQITKTVTGIVPGMSKHWNYWNADLASTIPAAPYFSPSPCVIIPAVEQLTNTAIFCRVIKTGNDTDYSVTGGSKPFAIQKGKCTNRTTNVNSSTGLSSRQVRVTYDGPLENTAAGPGTRLSYDTTFYPGGTNNAVAGFDIQTNPGNFNPWPDEWGRGIWWGFNVVPLGGFYNWGSYAGFLDYYQFYNLKMHPTGHSVFDFKGYKLKATQEVRSAFGYSGNITTAGNTSTFTITPKRTQIVPGWRLTDDDLEYFGGFEVTAVSHGASSTTITVAANVLRAANALVEFVPPLRIENVEVDPSNSSRHIFTFDDKTAIHTRSAIATAKLDAIMGTLMFQRPQKSPWESWTTSLRNVYYSTGRAPRITGNVTNSNAVPCNNVNTNLLANWQIGMEVFLTHSGTPSTATIAQTTSGGKNTSYQGNRTLQSITVTGTQGSYNIGNLNLSGNVTFGSDTRGIMGKKDHGYTLEVKIGQWTEDREESSGYGVEVFNSNGELSFSSDRVNFVVEHISSSTSCLPKLTTASGQGAGITPGRVHDGISAVTYEPTDQANYEDYWCLITSMGPVGRFCEGNGYTHSKWANNSYQGAADHVDTGAFTVPSNDPNLNHCCIYHMNWIWSFPGEPEYNEKYYFDNGNADISWSTGNLGTNKTSASKFGIGMCAAPTRTFDSPIDLWPGASNISAYSIGQDHFGADAPQYLIVGKLV